MSKNETSLGWKATTKSLSSRLIDTCRFAPFRKDVLTASLTTGIHHPKLVPPCADRLPDRNSVQMDLGGGTRDDVRLKRAVLNVFIGSRRIRVVGSL